MSDPQARGDALATLQKTEVDLLQDVVSGLITWMVKSGRLSDEAQRALALEICEFIRTPPVAVPAAQVPAWRAAADQLAMHVFAQTCLPEAVPDWPA